MKLVSGFCIVAAVVFLFIGCKKDEDATPGSLPGTWRMTDVHADNGVSTTTVLGQEISYTYSFHGKDYSTMTTFTENPNEFTSTGSYTAVTTINFQGQMTTTETPVDAASGTGTWSINGSTFTQVFAGETAEFEILELSDSKFRLKQDLDVTFDDNGSLVHNTATVYSTFEKK